MSSKAGGLRLEWRGVSPKPENLTISARVNCAKSSFKRQFGEVLFRRDFRQGNSPITQGKLAFWQSVLLKTEPKPQGGYLAPPTRRGRAGATQV